MNDPEHPDASPPGELDLGRHKPEPSLPAIFGSDGLRAGWALLLFALIYLAVQSGLRELIHASGVARWQIVHGIVGPRFTLWSEGVMASAVLIATWLMSRIEHRRLAAYGLAPARRARNLLEGAAWGLAFISLLVGLLKASGLLVFDRRELHGATLLRFGTVWLLGFALVGLFEELFFRGYLLATLTRGLAAIYAFFGIATPHRAAFWTAAVLLSFGFGLVHTTNPGESPVGVFAAGAIGLVLCFSLWRTGSLWWAIGFHWAWDWAESYLYGVYDSGLLARGRLFATHPHGQVTLSGGLTGPEGSLFILPVVGCVVAAIMFTVRPAPPSENRWSRALERSPRKRVLD